MAGRAGYLNGGGKRGGARRRRASGGTGSGWRSHEAAAQLTVLEPPRLDDPEDVFQAKCEALAGHFGWLYYHAHVTLLDKPGFPDLWLTYPGMPEAGIAGQFLVAELKTQTGRLKPEQKVWLGALASAGIETHLWRPCHWDFILARLSAPTQPAGLPVALPTAYATGAPVLSPVPASRGDRRVVAAVAGSAATARGLEPAYVDSPNGIARLKTRNPPVPSTLRVTNN